MHCTKVWGASMLRSRVAHYPDLSEKYVIFMSALPALPPSEARQTLTRLLDGSESIENVPHSLHPDLMVLLQTSKIEYQVAHKLDQARKCQALIENLRIGKSKSERVSHMRTRSCLSQTCSRFSRVSLLTTDDENGDEAASSIRQTTMRNQLERFWTLEFERFAEMREKAASDLAKKQQDEINAIKNSGQEIKMSETPAARTLRERHEENEEKRMRLMERAQIVDKIELNYRISRAKATLKDRIQKLKEDHAEQKKDFDRVWDRKYAKLKQDRDAEMANRTLPLKGKVPFSQSQAIVKPLLSGGCLSKSMFLA